jgi:transposase
VLAPFQRLGGRTLIALDGTEHFCSRKIHCQRCSTRRRSDGGTEYFHAFLGASIVAPGHTRVLPLPPEFVAPQDGAEKQDCERNAAKGWLARQGPAVAHLRPVYLGDDLFACQPIAQAIHRVGGAFILTCKPASHQTLSEYLHGATLAEHRRTEIVRGERTTTIYLCWGGRPDGIACQNWGRKQPRPEPSMTQYKRIGIDTSKTVFTIHGIDQEERPIPRANLRRAQVISFFRKLAPTVIALEACGGSHHWGRELIALGHKVRLIPPQYVKPYVKRGKNDRNDAEAICEAAGRPGMHFVAVKSVTQQAQGMLLKVRQTLIDQRTALINTVRGLAAEFGVIAGKGAGKIVPLLSAIEQDGALPPEAREMFALLGRRIDDIDARIKDIDTKLNAAHKASEVSQRLATIPGVGPVTALTLAVEIDPALFESGRHLAAWMGLTPKDRSTGGKQRMGGISRAGHERLRVLLVSGATAVINAAMRPGGRQMTEWLRTLLLRKPRKLVAVALANKMARAAWAMMTRGETYRRPVTAAGAVAA